MLLFMVVWESGPEAFCGFLWCMQVHTEMLISIISIGQDPRLDHDPVRVWGSCDTIGTMPPLEALQAPVPRRLQMMRGWGAKRSEWQEAVTR